MYRAIAAALLWFAVLWTLGSWAEAYFGINELVGFMVGLFVAVAIVTRQYGRRHLLGSVEAPATAAGVDLEPSIVR